MNGLRHLGTVVPFLPTLVCAGFAGATLTNVGPGYGVALSEDGRVVGCNGQSLASPYVWTAELGITAIGGGSGISVLDMSASGEVVVGQMFDLLGDAQYVAGRWTAATGWVPFDIPGQTGCPGASTAYSVSDDGAIAAGLAFVDGCSSFAFTATADEAATVLPRIGFEDKSPVRFGARANAISGDGTIVGGWDKGAIGTWRGSLWYPDGSQTLLGVPGDPGDEISGSAVVDLNADGTIAVGELGNGAYRWTQGEGMINLGSLPGDYTARATAVTDDGRVVAGHSGQPLDGFTAFIWTEEDGMQDLRQYLLDRGADVEGWTLVFVNDMTRDGRFITGAGLGPGGLRAWVAELDIEDNCPADVDGDGSVALTDLISLLAAWGECGGCPADIDGDDQVGVTDLFAVLAAWGDCR